MTLGYLLDTNVLSEFNRRQPASAVLDFIAEKPAATLYVSSLTLGELRRGVEKKLAKDFAEAKTLKAWVDRIEFEYDDRILPVDAEVATQWGRWTAGRSRPVVDTLLAATASVHGLVFVTRNVADVQDLPITILNPWHG